MNTKAIYTVHENGKEHYFFSEHVHRNLDEKGRARLEELERYISEKGLY